MLTSTVERTDIDSVQVSDYVPVMLCCVMLIMMEQSHAY